MKERIVRAPAVYRYVTLGFLILLAGCKARVMHRADSALDQVQAQGERPDWVDHPAVREKTPVFIHYVNETYSFKARNMGFGELYLKDFYEDFLKKLTQAENSQAINGGDFNFLTGLAKSIRADAEVFGNLTRSEITSLTRIPVFKSDSRPAFIYVPFSNDGILLHGGSEAEKKTLTSSSGIFRPDRQGEKFTVDIHYNRLLNPLEAAHPMAIKQTLSTILKRISEEFDPRSHRFILVIKSHGSKDYAVTTRLTTSTKDIPAEQIWTALLNARKKAVAAKKGLSGEGASSSGLQLTGQEGEPTFDVSAIDDALKEGLGGADQPGFGITKQELMDTLGQVGNETRMQFPLVFIESCKSYLTKDVISAMKTSPSKYQNIGMIFGSDDGGLPYRSLDYKRIIERTKIQDIQDVMEDELRRLSAGKAVSD